MENTAAKVVITGQVQGVGFRSWVEGNAKRLDLNGWVRNRNDGSVEALFKGEKSSVVAMISLCEEGPPAARVEKVSVDNAEGIVEDGFSQKPTV